MPWTTAVAALRARFPSLGQAGSSATPRARVRRALRTIATSVVALGLPGMDGCPDQWLGEADSLDVIATRALRGATPTVTALEIT